MLSSLLTLALLSPTADASFGGKIKNIRVRQRGSGAGYRVVVVVKDDSCDGQIGETEACYGGGHGFDFQGLGIHTALTAVDGGPTISDGEATQWLRQRVSF